MLAVGVSALGGCADEPLTASPAPYAPGTAPPEQSGPLIPPAAAENRVRIGLLAPLTGPRADLGASLVRGAQMALDDAKFPGVPMLDVRDTTGTPEGARAAAEAAAAAGDIALLGPLTTAETAAAAVVAQGAGLPMLAFTNDAAQARPGVWVLGVTSGQQVARLSGVLRAQQKTRVAALLPDGDFGRSLADALAGGADANGLTIVQVRTHGADAASVADALSALSGGAAPLPPGGQLPPAIAVPGVPAPDPPPPLPFDALFLGDAGAPLGMVIKALPRAGIDRAAVRIAGPSLWAAPNSGAEALPGAWYAAPDPAARTAFATQYAADAHKSPHPVADLAYDAATLLRTTPPGALPGATLAGVDGPLRLEADGSVSRSLAVFEVTRGKPRVIDPAPADLAAAAPRS